MSTAKKIAVLTDTLTDNVFESLPRPFAKSFFRDACSIFEPWNGLEYLADSDLFDTDESYRALVAASVQVPLIGDARNAILADGEVDDNEIALAVDILAPAVEAIKRVDPTYKQFSPLTDDDLDGVCNHADDEKTFINPQGGPDYEANIIEMLCYACAVRTGNDSVFNLYERLRLLAFKLIFKADGSIAAEEAEKFDKVSALTASLRKTLEICLGEDFRENLLAVMESPPEKDLTEEKPGASPSGDTTEDALSKSIAELDKLIGLDAVKVEIESLSNYLKVEEKRKAAGLPGTDQSMHFVFTGNPGTGKTTVARIMAKLLYGFNVLSEDKLIETDRASLVGGFIGQTAIKTAEVLESALNGVLFVDEAYTLSSKGGEDYGKEAIETILKAMEDNRDSLVVIAAGYTKEMEQFLATNPGLESRFTRFIHFPDYNVKDLCKIFVLLTKSNQYTMDSAALGNLAIIFHHLYTNRDNNFANGRLVRNLFEKTLGNHSDRIVTLDNIDKKVLTTITEDDFPYDVAGIEKIEDLSDTRWLAKCPDCGIDHKVKIEFIGKSVRCKCDNKFRVPFWNIVPNSLALKKIVSEQESAEMLVYN